MSLAETTLDALTRRDANPGSLDVWSGRNRVDYVGPIASLHFDPEICVGAHQPRPRLSPASDRCNLG